MVNYSICKNTNVQGHCSTHTPVGRLATGKDVIWKITPNNSFFLGEHYGQHGGGANNNDTGLNNVFIAGSGISTGLIPSALHVSGLWANGLPTYPGSGPGYTTGTVFILPTGNTPPVGAQGMLWIM